MGITIKTSDFSLKANLETYNKLAKIREDLDNINLTLINSHTDLEETAEEARNFINRADELIGVILYGIKLNVMTQSYKEVY